MAGVQLVYCDHHCNKTHPCSHQHRCFQAKALQGLVLYKRYVSRPLHFTSIQWGKTDEDYSPQIDLDDDEITQDEVIMRAQQRCDLRDMKREMTSDSNLSFVFNNDENSQTLLDLGLSMSIIGSGGSSNSNIGTSIGTSKGDLKRTPSLGQGRGSFLGSKASESQLKTLNMLSAEPKQAATAKRPVVLANYAKATVASNATTPSSIEVQAGSSKNSLKRPATVPSPATVTPTTKKAKTSSSSSTSAGIPKPSLLSKVLRTTSASIF